MKRIVMLICVLAITSLSLCASRTDEIVNDSSISSERMLDEVIVTSQYQHAKRVGDKFVVSIKNNLFFQDKTLLESLNLCPLITHQGDNYQILGKGATQIYINGRPSTLSGNDLIAYLGTLSTNEVAKVEIIPNPSGRMSNANNSGVINIVTSSQSYVGVMGMLNAGAYKGKDWGEHISGMTAFGYKELSLNLFVNFANHRKVRKSESLYQFNTTDINEISNFKQHAMPLATNASLEWKQSNNLLGCSYAYSSLNANADYTNQSADMTWSNTQNIDCQYHTAQVYDDFKFNNNTLSFLYNFHRRANNSNDDYYHNALSKHYDNTLHNLNNVNLSCNSNITDYLNLEYGVSLNILDMKSDFAFDDWKNNITYFENVKRGYLQSAVKYGPCDMALGLTYEHTNQTYTGEKKIYAHWLPNASITYSGNWGQYYAQFSKTIDRLPYTSITLSPVYFSPNSMTIGNPHLIPTVNYSTSIGMVKDSFSLELFYKNIKNGILSYSYLDNNTVVNSFTNFEYDRQYGVNISWSEAIRNIILTKLDVSSYLDDTSLSDGKKNHSWNNYLNASVAIQPDSKNRYDITVSYWNLFPQEEQGVTWKNRGSLNCMINYNVQKLPIKISLGMNDIFNQDYAHTIRKFNSSTVTNINTFDTRKLVLTVRYMFSNKRRVERNNQKNIDGLNRLSYE